MSRLFAYMGNDPARVACALYPARKTLVADAQDYEPPAQFDSWGIGFYQGEVLLQRRPKAPVEPVDFYAVARELRTDVIVGHVRAGTVGKPKNENTHPFRFRSWLFAHHGTIPSFESVVKAKLLDAVPDFLRRNVRGQTDSEHLFHLLLGHLQKSQRIDDDSVSPDVVCDALRATIAEIDEWSGERADFAMVATNGRILVGARRGTNLQMMRVQSILDCPVCREATPAPGKPAKRVDHEHLRAVLLVADVPAAAANANKELMRDVPDESFVAVAHDLSVKTLAIR